MAKKETTEINQMKFEQAFAELEELVNKLESGELDLEEAVQLFERGQALAKRCQQLLENADLKIRSLVENKKAGKG